MFDLASVVHKQTREYEKDNIVNVLSELEKRAENNIHTNKKRGNYSTIIETVTDTYIEEQALRLLRKKLKDNGYKVSIIHDRQTRWNDRYYYINVKWKTYTK